MDHAEARELIEIAAVEPAGLDRLMAGDTAEASRLAGHLADCSTCADELVWIRRVAAVVREVVRELPAADLKERTLAGVRTLGRPRGIVAAEDRVDQPSEPATRAPLLDAPGRRAPSASMRTLALVAAVLIAIAGTGIVVSAQRDAEVASQAAAIARADQAVSALAKVSAWSMRVGTEADAAHVRLAGAPGQIAQGTILFAPSSRELVVVVSDLAEPPAGQEYRCWVDIGGTRRPVGRMFFGGDLAYWVGPVEILSEILPGTTFGISLVDANGTTLSGEPVLSGRF